VLLQPLLAQDTASALLQSNRHHLASTLSAFVDQEGQVSSNHKEQQTEFRLNLMCAYTNCQVLAGAGCASVVISPCRAAWSCSCANQFVQQPRFVNSVSQCTTARAFCKAWHGRRVVFNTLLAYLWGLLDAMNCCCYSRACAASRPPGCSRSGSRAPRTRGAHQSKPGTGRHVTWRQPQ
jgi:hypothetical protein